MNPEPNNVKKYIFLTLKRCIHFLEAVGVPPDHYLTPVAVLLYCCTFVVLYCYTTVELLLRLTHPGVRFDSFITFTSTNP